MQKKNDEVTDKADLLNIIRNSISHTRLTLENGLFVFKDEGKNKIIRQVSIPSENIGGLIQDLIHASQKIIDIINNRTSAVSLN